MQTTTPWIDAVLDHVRLAADRAADRWSGRDTGLLADGFSPATGEPSPWRWCGRDRIISNLASQQTLLRTLVGLSTLTGDPSHAQRARQIVAAGFRHLAHADTGLLRWGSHTAWDLRHDEPFGYKIGHLHHELKCHFPFYELMWEVDPDATRRYIEAFWNAHVRSWATLDFSRHGPYEARPRETPMWHDRHDDPPIFSIGTGLAFVNTGSDLWYAAAMLHHFTGDPGPLTWARHMAGRFHRTAHPDTGLVGYQFSLVDFDRARAQFGPELGPDAHEGAIVDSGRCVTRYARVGLIQFQLARQLGAAGADFGAWAHEDLSALARHTYDHEHNLLLPMLTSGRRLSPDDIRRPGYYSVRSLQPWTPQALFFRVYAAAYSQSGDPLMWRTAARMGLGLGLPDLGPQSGGRATSVARSGGELPADPDLLHGLLELWRATGRDDLLGHATAVGDQMLRQQCHGGLFMESPGQRFIRIDARQPLALLHLAAAHMHGRDDDRLPADRAPHIFFSAEHDDTNPGPNGQTVRSEDNLKIYAAG